VKAARFGGRYQFAVGQPVPSAFNCFLSIRRLGGRLHFRRVKTPRREFGVALQREQVFIIDSGKAHAKARRGRVDIRTPTERHAVDRLQQLEPHAGIIDRRRTAEQQ
jgi:hypothetical protein